jgi:hypothetical protein
LLHGFTDKPQHTTSTPPEVKCPELELNSMDKWAEPKLKEITAWKGNSPMDFT